MAKRLRRRGRIYRLKKEAKAAQGLDVVNKFIA
jgi:hypothetical protein